jgi:hypothetical protein
MSQPLAGWQRCLLFVVEVQSHLSNFHTWGPVSKNIWLRRAHPVCRPFSTAQSSPARFRHAASCDPHISEGPIFLQTSRTCDNQRLPGSLITHIFQHLLHISLLGQRKSAMGWRMGRVSPVSMRWWRVRTPTLRYENVLGVGDEFLQIMGFSVGEIRYLVAVAQRTLGWLALAAVLVSGSERPEVVAPTSTRSLLLIYTIRTGTFCRARTSVLAMYWPLWEVRRSQWSRSLPPRTLQAVSSRHSHLARITSSLASVSPVNSGHVSGLQRRLFST